MRIVVVEDNVLLAQGLNLMLTDEGHEVVALAGDAAEFEHAVAEHRPDLAVVDVRLPPSFRDEGLRAAIRVRSAHPGFPVLVLSQYVEYSYATELLAHGDGGIGYLLKDRVGRVSEFLDALERVAAGGTAMDREVIGQLVGHRTGNGGVDRLTSREREVLSLMAQGRGNTEIADHLVLTERAVSKHISNIFGKLDLPPNTTGHRRVRAVLAYLRQN
ncbi:response regulator transcription factor [Actinophytocola gossypii]|uniref:Response regulator transcription factor n=1 Tax=Actinophytocola gossypii TaxID=2812003 RepID=A0ABT2JAD9_9PSEU|nr:response regulator transcription factor [Actinophytocola gossypii]MCT2584746.1 response regulator transcription factor [Actinophytocola gossypii]